MRDIKLLHPTLRPKAEELIRKAKAVGIDIIITQTLRTKAEQDALYAQGRTKPGSIVTNAKYPQSLHCWGVAFDFAVMVNGKVSWNEVHYSKVGPLGESLGLVWGGRWKNFPDKPHFELPGYSWSALQKQHGTPEKFIAAWKAKEVVKLFKDIATHWVKKDVEWLSANGIIQPAEKFRPDDKITRAETVALIARSIEYVLKQMKG